MSTLFVMKLLLLVTITVGFSGGLLAWRERPEPGAVPLTILLAGQCWWSVTLFFRINATGLQAKVFWTNIAWIGVAILPVAWLFFCLSYTGYQKYVRPRYVLLAMIVPTLTIVFGLTNQFHHLLYTRSILVLHGDAFVLDRAPGFWFWVIAAYTYTLGLLGAITLLQFVSSDVSIFRGQSLALLVGLVIPWVTNVLHLLGALPTSGIDPTPVAFSISAIMFLGALTRFQLLGTSPAPIRPARRSIFDRMDSGVIVLDRQDNIVDMNDSAARAVGTGPEVALGQTVESVAPELLSSSSQQASLADGELRPNGGTNAYSVSTSELTDAHGRTTGKIVSLHDISEYLRQQQRIEVLNRVFRHNFRTNTQLIISRIEHLEDTDSESVEKIKESVQDIEELSEKIRTILDIFEQGRTGAQPVKLATILEEYVESVGAAYPEVSFQRDRCSRDVYVDKTLDPVLYNVIENAAEHNTEPDPTVRIDVTTLVDSVKIEVRDNGPGIEDEELALFTEGTETPLHHGTGLGLALILWGTELADGRVTFEANDPTGTIVTVVAPIRSESVDQEPQ